MTRQPAPHSSSRPAPQGALPRLLDRLRQLWRAEAPLVWALSVIIGILAGYAVLLFRFAIGRVQWLWLGTEAENIVATKASLTHPLIVFAAPVAGGLIVGLLLVWLAPKRRASGVADVIEAAHLRHGVIHWRDGLASAIITIISLGSGASAGREGPAVHIGASVASVLFRPIKRLSVASRRVLIGAGAAAAVAASFNAPIAGMIFAHEVILGHYAMSAFVPTVLAAVAGTIITRVHLGDYPAFILPPLEIRSYVEFPAFALLGLLAGLVAVVFLRTAETLDVRARAIPMPLWLRPLLGGVLIGLMGVFIPQILGVGYEATSQALRGKYELGFLVLLLAAKLLATAITLASRFGGGVFSPSLFLGAMTGGIVGHLAAMLAPQFASDISAYAVVGTAAVAGAVLGAPLSTALIVFEMTNDYRITIALLIATSIAAVVMQVLAARSFFHWQLQQRGLDLVAGPHRRIMHTMTVADFITPPAGDDPETPPPPFDERPALSKADTLERALRAFNSGNYSRLAVTDAKGRLIGWADYARALEAFNAAMIEAEREEHH